jgi:hypothetical protein
MRISWAGLLVTIVIMVPIIVELRTVFIHVGFDVSLAETALLGLVMIGALVLWAVAPDLRGKGRSNGG